MAQAGHTDPVPPVPRASEGMTLRDYFAAQALPSAIAHMEFRGPAELQDMSGSIARACYFLADAMMAERSRSCPAG